MIVRACKSSNFGDSLNYELVKLISGEYPTIVNNSFKNENHETIYMCIGSIIGWSTKDTIIWGAGKMSETDATMFKEKPKEILAVRGPRTREQLLKRGYDCPEVYGDPALLMSFFYKPDLQKKYKVSVIPHAIDRVLIPELEKKFPDAHFIDITQLDIYKFIDEVIQSEYIISSALHGCIMAYAYGVPYEHQKFSEKVLGNGFKFQDFEDSKPLINYHDLISCCPFKKDKE